MSPFIRVPSHRYQDPLSRIWIACAEQIGFRVKRTADAYASTDGKGNLLIGEDALLDPDDNLAQMIFHELCHALVEGDEGERLQDWGLDNTSGRHTWREYATLRLQAYLAESVGLREFFAPTTDFRVKFWASLPDDPFQSPGGRRERSCVAARLAVWRAEQPRWKPHLEQALRASAAIAAMVPTVIGSDSNDNGLPSLWATCGSPPEPHTAGHSHLPHYRSQERCSDCAWQFLLRGHPRCRHAPEAKLPADTSACARWEPATELDCRTCGACCREAYHSVEVAPGESVVRKHPELVIHHETHSKLRREGERCVALLGGVESDESFSCRIYPHRPRTCRDFTLGSAHCLDARRRVGLSL
jgi:hypothetical protein